MEKTKRSMNENAFEIEDVFADILLRLPIKSLMICKCVCKSWRRLICSSSFIHLHLIQSRENPTYIFYSYPDDGKGLELVSKTDGEITESFSGRDGSYFIGMICSFNGLICCFTSNIIKICNPATREVLCLPPTHVKDPYPIIGVSFDPTLINGYKVFQIFESKELKNNECMVFSSITGSWKSIGIIGHYPKVFSKHVWINGIVHWLCQSRKDDKEFGFGLSGHYILAVTWEEKFSIIRIPEKLETKTKKGTPFLVNLEGCLCLVVLVRVDFKYYRYRFDIWVIQDSKESIWVKKLSDFIPIYKIEFVNRVDVVKNSILFGNHIEFAFYNTETRSWRKFKWESSHGGFIGCYYPVVYVESILPCKLIET